MDMSERDPAEEPIKSDAPDPPAKTGDSSETRDENGRWRSGVSGNPNGRPAGSRHRASVAVDEMIEARAKEVSEAALILAVESLDGPMLRDLLTRISPPRRGRTIQLDLPPLQKAQDCVTVLSAISQAVAQGEITPDEGVSLSHLVAGFSRAVEVAELAARLEAIEKALAAQTEVQK